MYGVPFGGLQVLLYAAPVVSAYMSPPFPPFFAASISLSHWPVCRAMAVVPPVRRTAPPPPARWPPRTTSTSGTWARPAAIPGAVASRPHPSAPPAR